MIWLPIWILITYLNTKSSIPNSNINEQLHNYHIKHLLFNYWFSYLFINNQVE